MTFASLAQRRFDMPDLYDVRETVPRALSTAGNRAPSYTTISGGMTKVTFPNFADNVSLIGWDGSCMAPAPTVSGFQASVPNWRAANDGTSRQKAMYTSSFGVEFGISSSRYIEFLLFTTDANLATYKIWVDGRQSTDLPITTTWINPSYNLVKLDLGDWEPHRVRLMAGFCGIGKIYTNSSAMMWPTALKGPRLAILGDSYTGHTTMNTGSELGTWLPRFASMVGIDDYWNGAISGTGPTIAANGYPNYQDRAVSDIVPTAADLILVGGWINELTHSTVADVQAAYGNIFTTLTAMASEPAIIAFGAPDPTGVNGPVFTPVDEAVAEVAADFGVAYISQVTGTVYDGAGAVVYESEPWLNTLNSSTYIGSDGMHANDYGHKTLAHRWVDSYQALLAA